jgi:hypothetical protein
MGPTWASACNVLSPSVNQLNCKNYLRLCRGIGTTLRVGLHSHSSAEL